MRANGIAARSNRDFCAWAYTLAIKLCLIACGDSCFLHAARDQRTFVQNQGVLRIKTAIYKSRGSDTQNPTNSSSSQ